MERADETSIEYIPTSHADRHLTCRASVDSLRQRYEAARAMIYWTNPVHPNPFADSIEERLIDKVHEMLDVLKPDKK